MRIKELTLSAVDLEQMRQFYCGIFGFREIEPFWTGRLAIQAGDTRIIFLPAPQGWHGRYHFAFDVPPGRFDAALSWLRERRGPIASPTGESQFHSWNWNADSVYFPDTQGNILELIVRHDLPSEDAASRTSADDQARQLANRPFNASEIVAVTEIGICASSVADTVAQLMERMPGLDVYDGKDSDTFTAVGDIHGLFIVVRQGRIWFPETGVPALPLPLELLVELEIGQRYDVKAPPFPVAIQPV